MIAGLLAIALALQFNQRPALTPAETLLESVVLRAITEAPVNEAVGPAETVAGADAKAGTIALTCGAAGCETAGQAVQKLRWLIGSKGMARQAGSVEARPFENLGQPQLDRNGVPTTTIVTGPNQAGQAASAAAATAYFLASLPNDGAEALLAHLTVGAQAARTSGLASRSSCPAVTFSPHRTTRAFQQASSATRRT